MCGGWGGEGAWACVGAEMELYEGSAAIREIKSD